LASQKNSVCVEENLKIVHELLTQIVDSSSSDHQYIKTIEILLDQIKLILFKKRQYSVATMIFAFVMFTKSSSTYEMLRKFLILPTKRHLQQISSSFNVSPNIADNNEHYLSFVTQHLTEIERKMYLLIDEIYIAAHAQYKSQIITGFAENREEELATTVMSFMISSAFGRFKEIVRLVPVKNCNAEGLYTMTNEVLNFVQNLNIQVIGIITDNHQINQKLFKMLTATSSEKECFQNPSPSFKDHSIFLIYDTVHLWKNIRNNSVNLINLDKTFVLPDFPSQPSIKKKFHASFSCIRKYYQKDKNRNIKKAFKLSYKTLYPSSIDRLNVKLVDNLFHDSTIAALQSSTTIIEKETSSFLEIIKRWWSIMNGNCKLKGILKRNSWCLPFYCANDGRFQFLEDFTAWLVTWHQDKNNNGWLTACTNDALRHSTIAITKLIKYSLDKFKIEYFLPGKCLF
jgi:hypothetical protein